MLKCKAVIDLIQFGKALWKSERYELRYEKCHYWEKVVSAVIISGMWV